MKLELSLTKFLFPVLFTELKEVDCLLSSALFHPVLNINRDCALSAPPSLSNTNFGEYPMNFKVAEEIG